MILNEVLQWFVLVVLGLLTLGVLRQVSLMMPPQAASMSGPPTGRRAPPRLSTQLRRVLASESLQHGALVAFVTENCVGCQKLLADISEGRQQLNGQPLVVIAHRPSDQFRGALEETGLPLIVDEGQLWDDCRITSTPLVVLIDERGRVTNKEVTHRVERVAVADT